MNFEKFKLSSLYEIFANPMKITSYFVLKDINDKGFSFSELEKAFEGELSAEEIDNALMVLEDIFEVHGRYEQRGDRMRRIYKIDTFLLREPLKDLMFLGQREI